jgi:methionine-rich copper-binding protein CopC
MKSNLIIILAISLVLFAVLVASAAWFSVPVVSAHANLVRSEPPANSVLDQSPTGLSSGSLSRLKPSSAKFRCWIPRASR